MLLSSTNEHIPKTEVVNFGTYITILKKSWLTISLFTILCTAIAVLVVLSITPSYRATATILIEANQKKAVSIEEIVGIDSSKKEYYATQYEILKSNQVAQKVIHKLNLSELSEFNGQKEGPPSFIQNIKIQIKTLPIVKAYIPESVSVSNEQKEIRLEQYILNTFKKKLTIAPIRKTQLVKITFESVDPILAAQIANEVGNAFIENNLESRLLATKQASSWITTRLQELKEELLTSEEKLTTFLKTEKLIDSSGIDNLANTELGNLTNRLSRATERTVAAESLYESLSQNKNAELSTLVSISEISNHPQIRDIRKAEVDVKKQVNELSKRYGPKHDKMIRAQAQLKSIQLQTNKIIAELAKGIEKELQSARRQQATIKRELNNKKDDFQKLAIKKSRYDSLKREVDTNTQLYNLFLTRQKETSATSDFNSANARFTDFALIPLEAAAPKKKKLVIGAMLASLLFAMIMSILIDSLKNTIESAKDFENKFGLLPLGGIPTVRNKKFKNKPLDNTLFFEADEHAFSESIRSIRTSLLMKLVNTKRKRVSITSSIPGEGKTTTSINIAMSLAKMEKVVLIDCDLRKPSIAERFGLSKNQQGLTNHLLMGVNLEECLYHDENSGLIILPAGMLSPNPQELLSSPKFTALLEKLEQQVDRVILDTPPTLAVSDSLIISKLAGAAVIVIKANSTKIPQIQSTMSKMIQHDISIDGLIINQLSRSTANTEHGYGQYGQYYQSTES